MRKLNPPKLYRPDSSFPYQLWRPFPDNAIVWVENIFGDAKVGPAHKFWWGYEEEMGAIGEGVIIRAKRLDRPKWVKLG